MRKDSGTTTNAPTRRTLGTLLHETRGIAAVETAIMLPIFFLLLMGALDFGRLFWFRNVAQGAAEEGARLAVLAEPTNAEVMARVRGHLADGGVTSAPEISISQRISGQPVTVTVSVPFEYMTMKALMSSLLDVSTVHASSAMLHER